MIKWTIILLYILMKGFEAIIDYFDKSTLGKELPENVRDVYNSEEYEKYVSYAKENGKLDLIENILTIILELSFLIFNLHSSIFNNITGGNIYLQYLIFIIVMVLINLPISIVFSYYETFAIEEKYGMNKSTKKTFFLDKLKGFIISIIVAFLLMCIIMFFFIKLGKWAVFYVSLSLLAITLIIAMIVIPLMRIFNKFTPLEDGPLKEKLLELCTKYNVKVKKIVVKDASKRTTKSNAFCTGLKEKTISLDDNLVKNFTEDEIVAVFAHEFAHAKYKHVIKSLPFSALSVIFTVIILGLVIYFDDIYSAFGFNGVNYYFAQEIVAIGIWPVNIIFEIIGNRISRKHEYEADAFAAKEGYGPELISALKKLSKESLSDINPHPAVVVLSYSHPTLSQRVSAITDINNK